MEIPTSEPKNTENDVPPGNHLLETCKLRTKELLPQRIWDQLGHLCRRPRPDLRSLIAEKNDPDPLVNTFLKDEIQMCEITSKKKESLQTFLLGDPPRTIPVAMSDGSTLSLNVDTLSDTMTSMIMMSDIGKAGGEAIIKGQEEPVVARLYTDLFLDGRHGDWIKSHQERAKVLMPESDIPLPINFLKAPISLTLEAAQNVAMEHRESIPEEDIKKRFSLTEAEREELRTIGFDPDTTSMGTFFTSCHISEGEKFLLDVKTGLPDSQKIAAILGLSHHFTNGVLPKEFTNVNISDPSVYKMIAYTEILDKVHAFIKRSRMTPEKSFEITRSTLRHNLAANKSVIPNCPPYIEDLYEETFQFFETQILASFKEEA